MAKILIADDIEGVRRMLIRALEDEHSIIEAENGLEAVRKTEIERPDLVILDLDMPIMDGVEAARQIKENPNLTQIKVLAMTGQRNSENSRLIRDFCDAFMEKPFRVSELRELVKQLISQR
ncbi:MAG TPA: response regulator [Blastocatellia bacterium]|nr:response regulator [Blastocatellia bacterium]